MVYLLTRIYIPARSAGGGLVSFAAKIAKSTKTLRTMRSLRLTIFHCQSNRFTQVVITHQKLKASITLNIIVVIWIS